MLAEWFSTLLGPFLQQMRGRVKHRLVHSLGQAIRAILASMVAQGSRGSVAEPRVGSWWCASTQAPPRHDKSGGKRVRKKPCASPDGLAHPSKLAPKRSWGKPRRFRSEKLSSAIVIGAIYGLDMTHVETHAPPMRSFHPQIQLPLTGPPCHRILDSRGPFHLVAFPGITGQH